MPQAIALVCAFIKDYKPHMLVMNGDMLDLCTISKFVRAKSVGQPHTVAEEVRIGIDEVIRPLCQAAPKARKIWVEGNHEFRLVRYIATFAKALEGLIDTGDVFGCKELGIDYIPSKGGNGIFQLTDHLAIMHGDRAGINPAKAQYEQWGASLIMGHTHKESTWRKKHGCGRDDIALSGGCLCLDPDWRDTDNYTRGFIAGTYEEVSGEFAINHVRIAGENHVSLYSPWGNYEASYNGKNKRWSAKRRDSSYKG
jgi:predicted phosphodiesterase